MNFENSVRKRNKLNEIVFEMDEINYEDVFKLYEKGENIYNDTDNKQFLNEFEEFCLKDNQ